MALPATIYVVVSFLNVIFPDLVDVCSFSHTLKLVGKKVKSLSLSEVMLSWLSLFRHSPKARIFGRSRPTGLFAITVPQGGGLSVNALFRYWNFLVMWRCSFRGMKILQLPQAHTCSCFLSSVILKRKHS